jgi:hypothetical protein
MRKDVETYLNGLETEISYFKCLKYCSNQCDSRPKKEKKPLLAATHRSKRLNWASAHKS